MLSQLKVKNFAIIDNLTVEFKNGFTTLTGETGAGKSLVIDAIGLLFGNRSSSIMIRNGETKAIVEGIFENISDNTKKILEEFQIELLDDDVVVIKREISNTGKNLIRVNGDIVTLNQLEKIAITLGDIHTQEDTHKLFNQSNYLTFIETEQIKNALDHYNIARKIYLENLKEYQRLNDIALLDGSNLEFWEYQYNELTKAQLNIEEEDELNEELEYLNNFETIFKNMASIKETFEDNNILESLYDILNNLEKLSKFQSVYSDDFNKLNDFYYELEDFELKIKNNFKSLDFDEERLNNINDRLSELKSLKNKYKRNVTELIQFRDELKAKIEDFEMKDDKILACKNNVEKSYIELCDKTVELTNLRKESARKLEKSILNTLKDLMLEKVQLKIVFDDYKLNDPFSSSLFKSTGCDNIDIMITFNVGEPLRSLSKVASGGEMSRVMLALKVHVLKTLKLSTVIFDEIDSGVSGAVADSIGEKLKEISKNTQLLSITHLPIVASYSNNQYHIYKEFDDSSTKTFIKELNFDERVEYLANMINPNDETLKTKELAQSMLEKNK